MREVTKEAIERRNKCIVQLEKMESELNKIEDEMTFLGSVIMQEMGGCKLCQNAHWPHCGGDHEQR